MKNPYVPTSTQTATAMARLLGQRERILDLGCGDGVLLRAAAGMSPHASRLAGIEMEPERLPQQPHGRFEYIAGDALELPDEPLFDGIISNPPYLNVRHLDPRQRERLRQSFTALSGQFDLAFAFVEKAIRLLEGGGRGVFLLPEGIGTRPAAEQLRRLLDQHCQWDTAPVPERPYGERAGVEAEILWFDRSDGPPRSGGGAAATEARSPLVSVGIATGADSTFIKAESDPWLETVDPCFIRPFVRGRDIINSEPGAVPSARGQLLIVPYALEGGSPSPADPRRPGLAPFIAAHRGQLGKGSSRGPGLYIQCPPPSLIGTRVVVPEVFRVPAARVVPHGVAVLNSAFIAVPRHGMSAPDLAEMLNSAGGRRAIARETRRLGSGYHRITARGLYLVLKGLTDAADMVG